MYSDMTDGEHAVQQSNASVYNIHRYIYISVKDFITIYHTEYMRSTPYGDVHLCELVQ